ncbi:GNAT family N-acetyltransferase [Chelativorans sp. Marseille-P2723]|uniref:GNAT family N-acetyltransferase n=1 Tax=Chelativorans sp. Marseille-P2723 TaxID=2709133 RepID=UPI00156E035B|nr:GNAT family N-acetyltransferase [Chelativorans sp. Marseille-P2723]
MALSFAAFRRRSFAVRPVEIADAPALAALHSEDFARSWSDGEFEALLAQSTVFGFAAVEEGDPSGRLCGFVLARSAGGEAEILTLVVPRPFRRRGIGYLLMDAVLRALHGERADALFLEVDENNTAALALYRRLGFREVGRRPGYYRTPQSHPSNALVMRRDLG